MTEMPAIRVLFYSDFDDYHAWRSHLAAALPQIDLIKHPAPVPPESIDFALVYQPPAGLLAGLPNLKAVLSLAAGLDHLGGAHGAAPSVPVFKFEDPGFAAIMAEYVLAAVMRHHRDFPVFAKAQADNAWSFAMPLPAAERHVGIAGLGPLGLASAQLLSRVGFKVSAWSRSKRDANAPEFAGISLHSGEAGLRDLALTSEIFICLLPLTDETRGILDARLMAWLPRGAALINAGRGAQLVPGDLVAALDSGHVSFATLDVLIDEPPKENDPLWRHSKVFVTPHIAAAGRPETAAAVIAARIRSLLGRPD